MNLHQTTILNQCLSNIRLHISYFDSVFIVARPKMLNIELNQCCMHHEVTYVVNLLNWTSIYLNGLYLRNGHQRDTWHNVIGLCDQNILIMPSSICDTTQRAYALRETLIWPPTSLASQLWLWIWTMISDHMRPFPNRRTKEDKNPRRIRSCIYVCMFLALGQWI